MAGVKLELDEGYLPVTVPVQAGEQIVEQTICLDLYEANNAYWLIVQEFDDQKPVEQGEKWVEWLMGKGFPPISHAAAFRLSRAIIHEVSELKKKTGPGSVKADSRDSSESASTAATASAT